MIRRNVLQPLSDAVLLVTTVLTIARRNHHVRVTGLLFAPGTARADALLGAVPARADQTAAPTRGSRLGRGVRLRPVRSMLQLFGDDVQRGLEPLGGHFVLGDRDDLADLVQELDRGCRWGLQVRGRSGLE